MIAILILAAGASSRMRGTDKLLLAVAGETLLRRQARIALAAAAQVIVVLPPDRPLRAQALAGLGVTLATAPDAASGMAASLRTGVQAVVLHAPDASGLMVLPADMPGFDTADLGAVMAAFDADPSRIVRAMTEDGIPGHPAVFPAALFPELAAVSGDEGGRSVLARHRDRVRLLALPGQRAILDLDTPEDWAEWHRRQERQPEQGR